MVPYGNCRNAPIQVVSLNENQPITPGNNYIVSELILDNDVCNHLRNLTKFQQVALVHDARNAKLSQTTLELSVEKKLITNLRGNEVSTTAR